MLRESSKPRRASFLRPAPTAGTMPPSFAHLALFGGGLLLGAGTSALVVSSSSKKPTVELAPSPAPPAQAILAAPSASSALAFRQASPGEDWQVGVPCESPRSLAAALRHLERELTQGTRQASTSDLLRRRAYITAYDRRLQHRASKWLSLSS